MKDQLCGGKEGLLSWQKNQRAGYGITEMREVKNLWKMVKAQESVRSSDIYTLGKNLPHFIFLILTFFPYKNLCLILNKN